MRHPKVRPLVAAMLVCVLALAVPMGAGAADMGPAATWTPWASLRAVVENWPLIVIGSALEWSVPDIDGKYVVYEERLVDGDGTGPGSSPGNTDVYLVNLNTGVRSAVATGTGNQYEPAISGDWVVYTDDSNGTADVKAYRIGTGQRKNVAVRTAKQSEPDISGSKVVYSDAANGIHAFDLNTNGDTLVSASGGQPAISGDRVVYKNGSQIVLASLRGGLSTILDADGGDEQVPCISGDYVAWVETGDQSIAVRTISTGASKSIAPPAGEESYYPAISGATVVWRNYPGSGGRYLVGYDIIQDKAVTLANAAPDSLTFPAIDGARLACVQMPGTTGAFGDIMLGTLKVPTVSLSSPATVNYGGKPKLTGSLTENGEVLGNKALDVLKSTDSGFTYTKVGTVTTNSDGAFSYTLPVAYATARYRVRYNGETWGFFATELSHFSAHSVSRNAVVRASVGKPTGYPSTGNDTKTYSVYGSLKPRQTATAASAGVVVIQCYRRQSGKWKLRKTVKARVYDYDTYSRYKGSVRLPYTGKWRLRAYFKGSTINAEKYSSYRYVTVN